MRLSIEHPSAYALTLTAIAVVALVEQLLDGTCSAPGVHLMGLLADPDRLMHDLARLGAGVEASQTTRVPIEATA